MFTYNSNGLVDSIECITVRFENGLILWLLYLRQCIIIHPLRMAFAAARAIIPPPLHFQIPPTSPGGLPWYAAVIIAIGSLIIVLGALYVAWIRLGPQVC